MERKWLVYCHTHKVTGKSILELRQNLQNKDGERMDMVINHLHSFIAQFKNMDGIVFIILFYIKIFLSRMQNHMKNYILLYIKPIQESTGIIVPLAEMER